MSDKKVFRYFVLPEYEEEEQFLMEMAKKGYLFEKVSLPGIYLFQKGEPTDMIYRIDFNPQKKSDRESYLQMFRDYGWEYIQDLNDFSYFCKKADGSEDEILSDNASRIEMLERIQNRKWLPMICIFLCCLLPQGMRISAGNYSDTIAITFYVFWMIILLLYIYIITRCLAGFRRLKEKYGLK